MNFTTDKSSHGALPKSWGKIIQSSWLAGSTSCWSGLIFAYHGLPEGKFALLESGSLVEFVPATAGSQKLYLSIYLSIYIFLRIISDMYVYYVSYYMYNILKISLVVFLKWRGKLD